MAMGRKIGAVKSARRRRMVDGSFKGGQDEIAGIISTLISGNDETGGDMTQTHVYLVSWRKRRARRAHIPVIGTKAA